VFGNVPGGGSNNEDFYIGETKLYDTLLTAAEILALYNGGDGLWETADTDTRALWQFREGTGVALHDQSVNDQDGVITGATWVSAGVGVVGEACGGAHPDYTIVNTDIDGLTLYDGGVPISTDLYHYTPSGAITTTEAPAGAVTATYNHYVVSEAGGFHQWSLTGEAAEHDITDFRNVSGWKEWMLGLKSWTGTAQRFWIHHGLDFNLGDVRHLVKFYTNDAGDDRFEAWGYITGIGPNVEVGALIEETITIRGDDRFDYLIV